MMKRDFGRALNATTVVAAIATLSLSATSVHAGVFDGPMVTLDWWSSSNGMHKHSFLLNEDSQTISNTGGNVWRFGGRTSDQFSSSNTPLWDMGWEVTATHGPTGGIAMSGGSQFVNANLAVTNNSDTIQTFTALVTLDLPKAFSGGTLMNGSVSLSVTDVLGDGAQLTPSQNTPIYQAFIDGADQRDTPVFTMFDDPGYELIADPFATASDSDSFGIPTRIPGPEALDSISVMLTFELSPHDTANVVGTFEIIPGPGALAVLGIVGLLGVRRRRV